MSDPRSEAPVELISGSVEETQIFGERLGRLLRPGDVVALHGELGSGKTTLIQGLARGLGHDPAGVSSPTFVIMREYPGVVPLMHIDGYRLEGAPSAAGLDFELMFSTQKVTVIEWAERFSGVLPEDRLELRLAHLSLNRRRLTVSAYGPRANGIVAEVIRQPVAQPANPPTG